jgi:dGTPase
MAMDWQRLVSTTRLGREDEHATTGVRTEYLRDWDRLVYSSAFRRLQDKTQVFPLSDSDYVRTRLTHSIEVSSVGRSLGMLCGQFICEKVPGLRMDPQDFGSIIAAACLAHDIGNPPFGHSGEAAIQSWFNEKGTQYLETFSERERKDFLRFEGNAQGFRLITRLQNSHHRGGFQLTYAVLGAFGKYPRPSELPKSKKISEKKFGYCADDAENFKAVAEGVGLVPKGDGAYCRHPLAFLMEAADDVCYNIVDLEDGHRLGRIPFVEAYRLLSPIAFSSGQAESASYQLIDSNPGKVEYLRARAIGNLIESVVEVFKENYATIMDGEFEDDLVSKCKFASQLAAIKQVSISHIYTTRAVLEIEAAGFEILGGLLNKVAPALFTPEAERNLVQKKVAEIVPKQFNQGASPYQRLLGVTDYISGMTDTFALSMFRRLHGMELPGSSI